MNPSVASGVQDLEVVAGDSNGQAVISRLRLLFEAEKLLQE